MSWQLLIWNIFIWSFTGFLIYVKEASMFWLLVPLLLTAFNNAAALYKQEEKTEQDADQATLKQIEEIARKNKIKL
jgi:hypothetical protein